MASMKNSTMNIHTFRPDGNGGIVCAPGASLPLKERRWELEWRVSSPEDKETIIFQLECLLGGNGDAYEFLSQRAALMVDEMLENALFAAPRDAAGRPLYAKGGRRALHPGERICLRCAFDGERLCLEVSDSWGSLSPEIVRRYITLNLATDGSGEDRAGRGLFFMWRFMDDFYVGVKPGEETSIGGVLPLYPQFIEQGAEVYGPFIQD